MARSHAGESTPDRYADGSLAALPGVYRHPRRLWYLGLAAGAQKLAGGAAVAAGAGSGDGQRCAAAGETLSGLAARRGGADHGRALYQRFRSASGAAWHGAREKPWRRGYTQVCV